MSMTAEEIIKKMILKGNGVSLEDINSFFELSTPTEVAAFGCVLDRMVCEGQIKKVIMYFLTEENHK